MYIYKAAVIGAGAMGAEIAQVISYSGLPVILKDINDELVQKGLKHIREIYQKRVDKGKMSSVDLESKMNLIQPATGYEPLKEIDIVIEAVPEKMEIKKNVFQELDKICPSYTIFASNTSALSISEMARATARPEKVIGMHFFYPAHVMKLVEVIPGALTSEETTQTVTAFTESLRKIPVKVGECAGFLVNRLLMPYLNEAAFCLQEGADSVQKIDDTMVRFGMPMGPFTLVDNLGLDICYDVVQTLLKAYGERMKPAEIWQEMYTLKRLGKKNGIGFYNYSGDTNDDTISRLIRVIQDKLRVGAGPRARPNSEGQTQGSAPAFIPERLLFSMVNEAILCIEEKIANAWDIDMAMMAGVGFPQSTEGLLHYADSVGLDVILDQLKRFQQEHGIRFKPAPLLEKMVANGAVGKKAKRGFFEYV